MEYFKTIINGILICCLCIACTSNSRKTEQILSTLGLQNLAGMEIDVNEFEKNIGKDSVYVFNTNNRTWIYQYRTDDGYGQNEIYLDSLYLISYSFFSNGKIKTREVVLCDWLTNIKKSLTFSENGNIIKIIDYDSLYSVPLRSVLVTLRSKGLDVRNYELDDWGVNIAINAECGSKNNTPVWNIRWLVRDSVTMDNVPSMGKINKKHNKINQDKHIRNIVINGKTGNIISDKISIENWE